MKVKANDKCRKLNILLLVIYNSLVFLLFIIFFGVN